MINKKTVDKRTEKKKIGDLGEEIATKFLIKKGYKIIERNWQRKLGELDIIAKKDQIYYFVEVKTTKGQDWKFSPEDHLDDRKIRKIEIMSNIYVQDNFLEKYDNKLSAIFVYLNMDTYQARVKFWEQIF